MNDGYGGRGQVREGHADSRGDLFRWALERVAVDQSPAIVADVDAEGALLLIVMRWTKGKPAPTAVLDATQARASIGGCVTGRPQ